MPVILALLLACGSGELESPPVSLPADTGPPGAPLCTAGPTSDSDTPGEADTATNGTGATPETSSPHTGAPDDTGQLDPEVDTPAVPACDTGGHDTAYGAPGDTGPEPACVVVVDTAPVFDTAPPAVADTASPPCPVDTAAPACPEVDWIIHAPAWSTQYVKDLAVLPDGDIIVVGTYYRDFTLKAGEPDEVTIAEGPCAGAYEESWLARIGTDSTIRWAKQITASCYSARALELAIAPCGDIVVAGQYWDEPMTVAPGTPEEVVLPLPEGNEDNWWGVFTADGALRYARTMPSPGSQGTLDAIDVAEDGTIYIAGTYEDQITFDPGMPWSKSLQTGGDPIHRDIYVVAYEPYGRLRWAKAAGTGDAGHANVSALAAFVDGPVLVAHAYDTSIWGACEPAQTQFTETIRRRNIVTRFAAEDGDLAESENMYGRPTGGAAMGTDLLLMGVVDEDTDFYGDFLWNGDDYLHVRQMDGTPLWSVSTPSLVVPRDLDVAGGTIALTGEIGYYAGLLGDFHYGCGPTVEAPNAPFVSFNMKGLAWYTFTDAGEPQCGGWFGSIAGNDGQGVVVDLEGGLVIGATWWGDGTIGAGTPAETTLSTADYDIVIVRLAPP